MTATDMNVVVRCRTCDAGLPVSAREAPAAIECGRCGCAIPLSFSQSLQDDRQVDACPVCGGRAFYLRKDFNPTVGLSVVIVGASISAVFYWFGNDLIAYSILALAVVVDLLVYGRLAEVTVCYPCHAEFRGSYERTAKAFDLHTADVLEQEYERRIGRR